MLHRHVCYQCHSHALGNPGTVGRLGVDGVDVTMEHRLLNTHDSTASDSIGSISSPANTTIRRHAMLHLRRPRSNAIVASITTWLIVVLLAAAVHGTTSRSSRSAPLKCFVHGFKDDDHVKACSPGDLCLWSSYTFAGGESRERSCASQKKCDKNIARQSAKYRVVCCSTDLCNKDYDTATTTTTTTTTTPTTTTATTTTPTTTTPTTTTSTTTTTTTTTPTTTTTTETISASSATSAVHGETTMQQQQSTTDTAQPLPSPTTSAGRSTTTNQQSTSATGHASAASQSMPGRLTSIPAPANSTSTGPSPKTSSSDASIDNVTRIDVPTERGGTKDSLETTPTAKNTDKTSTSTASSRTSSASTTDQTSNTTTSTSLTSTTSGKEQPDASPMAYVWIALLGVGVIGAVISGVLCVLAFLGIVCAPKQSTGLDVISKELDKTLL